MSSYQYILFDWDGNLAKTLQIWLKCTVTVLKRHNHSHSERQVIDGLADLRALMADLEIKDVEEIVYEIRDTVHDLLPDVELYPDALYVLEALKTAGKRLALITSTHRQLVTPPLERFNLTGIFEVIITRDDVSHQKPHPEPLEIALKQFKAKRDEAIMIGDTEKDLGAAENAGIDSILFFPPEHEGFYDLEKLKQYNPTHIVSDFRHIIEIIG